MNAKEFFPKLELEEAARLIAFNDEPTDKDARSIEGYISVQLIADIYGVTAKRLSLMVALIREEEG